MVNICAKFYISKFFKKSGRGVQNYISYQTTEQCYVLSRNKNYDSLIGKGLQKVVKISLTT